MIDQAAGDDIAERMAVLEDRRDRTGRGVAERSLGQRPAVVLPAMRARTLEVDLLARALTNVADIEIAIGVEADAKGVAQAVGPDLVGARLVDEGVVVGNGVVSGVVGGEIVPIDV